MARRAAFMERSWRVGQAEGQCRTDLHPDRTAHARQGLFSPPGTTLTLTRAPGAELHVIDQGPGMPAADRERAFDRFWRASDSHHDGTGLGLPIVRHLVRASGGEITLHAAPGGGLDARVRLRPASAAHGFSGRQRAASESPRSVRSAATTR